MHVKWNGRHIPKSPFRVEVAADLDATQAYASGPGLQPEGVQAGKYTDFTVYTKDAGEGQVSVKVIDPRGGEDVDIIIEPQEDGKFFVEYQPVNAGKHTIKVMFGGQPISQSPFHVKVSPPRVEPIPSKVRVFGTGNIFNSLSLFCILFQCACSMQIIHFFIDELKLRRCLPEFRSELWCFMPFSLWVLLE